MRPLRSAATHDTMPSAQPSAGGDVIAIGSCSAGSFGSLFSDSTSAAFCASIFARSSGVMLPGFCTSGAVSSSAIRRMFIVEQTLSHPQLQRDLASLQCSRMDTHIAADLAVTLEHDRPGAL